MQNAASALTSTPIELAAARGRATGLAAERLRDLIVQGELHPGERLSERTTGERLGISRTPLREALKVLASEGLVTLEPNRGAVVTRLSTGEVEAAIAVLAALEGMAADIACARASDGAIAAVAALHARMVAHHEAGELLGYFHANQAIHEAIADLAGNPVLSRVYRAESGRIRRYRYAGNLDQERWDRAVREHEQILDALLRRDGPLLRELLRAHLWAGWQVVRGSLGNGHGASQ